MAAFIALFQARAATKPKDADANVIMVCINIFAEFMFSPDDLFITHWEEDLHSVTCFIWVGFSSHFKAMRRFRHNFLLC